MKFAVLCLTEMSVKCENSLISHEWYFRESVSGRGLKE